MVEPGLVVVKSDLVSAVGGFTGETFERLPKSNVSLLLDL